MAPAVQANADDAVWCDAGEGGAAAARGDVGADLVDGEAGAGFDIERVEAVEEQEAADQVVAGEVVENGAARVAGGGEAGDDLGQAGG